MRKPRNTLRVVGLIVLVSAVVTVSAIAASADLWPRDGATVDAVTADSEYQAVLLTNGLAYCGKIREIGAQHVVLTNVFAIKAQHDRQSNQLATVLLRRENEDHSPTRTFINTDHILVVEPVRPGSKLAKLIAEMETAKR